MSSGRAHRPMKHTKGGTETHKKHRFETFNQRVARLNIDPISKVRRQDVEKQDVDSTTSHFKTGLLSWRDLNLSENFTDFVQEVDPLCDSLPQILFQQDKIMDILVRYMEKNDALCLEPLMSLLSRLAHDLGARFEKHFARAFSVVTTIAATHPDIEVIEWSFSSLAWLFKYLSRLLVPDLRPVYDIMAQNLLGKARHNKPHVARFAAQAMSFLIRKAALTYHKDSAPLSRIISHSFSDLAAAGEDGKDNSLYRYGIMSLFSDAIKGINDGIHSTGTIIFQCLLESELTSTSSGILSGILVNIVHHTHETTFAPVLATLSSFVGRLDASSGHIRLDSCTELLFLAVGVRKASRIADWQPVLDCLSRLQELGSSRGGNSISSLDKTAATIFQYAPLDHVIPKVRGFMETLLREATDRSFVLFCIFFCDLGRERFKELIAPYFQKFVIANWQIREHELLEAVPYLLGQATGHREQPSGKPLPTAWVDRMVAKFDEGLEPNSLSLMNGYLHVLDALPLEGNMRARIARSLASGIVRQLNSIASAESTVARFTVGKMLHSLLRFEQDSKESAVTWPSLIAICERFANMPLFLENMIVFSERNGAPVTDLVPLIHNLIKNLTSASKALRESSLRLLDVIHKMECGDTSEELQIALTIESIPLDTHSARTISMHIRRLPGLYRSAEGHAWLGKAIAHFLFGLLTFRLSQAWDDSVEAMKSICESKAGEEVISTLAFKWLDYRSFPEALEAYVEPDRKEAKNERLNEFQCTNVADVDQMYLVDQQNIAQSMDRLCNNFERCHQIATREVPNASAQALRVFAGIPWVAEKRSRQLVPLFLSWASSEQEVDFTDPIEVRKEDELPVAMPRFEISRRDRKSMLEIFGLFSNPRVLFRSDGVYAALLHLLTNGDGEIQKSALRAIFTWKLAGIKPYQDNLMNILDDARFREEITVFLQTEAESGVRPEHRGDLIPVLLRLLYGKATTRVSSSSNKASSASRRKAVLDGLLSFKDEDVKDFVSIVLGPLLFTGNIVLSETASDIITVRQQVGLLNMLKDMLDVFGDRLSFFIHEIATCVLYCLTHAVDKLQTAAVDMQETKIQTSLYRDVRHIGSQCLILIFQRCSSLDLSQYIPAIFETLVNPRIDKLPIETAQSVSALLQLLSVWASNARTAQYLADYNPSLLDKVADILNVPSAKDDVILFAINEILKPLVTKAIADQTWPVNTGEASSQQILKASTKHILDCAANLLKKSPSKVLLASTIELVSFLAVIVEGSSQVRGLLEISSFLLNQPSQRVSVRSKGDLLQIVERFIPSTMMSEDDELFQRLFQTTSSLFGYFKDRDNRARLCAVISVLAQKDPELGSVAVLCTELNSYSTRAVDEPDYERRTKAYSQINETQFQEFSEKQWRPIVSNMLYFIKDNEELVIRTSASFALRRFAETASKDAKGLTTVPSSTSLMKKVLLPALRDGASERSELVRTEYLAVMAHVVRCHETWDEVNDMSTLLVNDDEEASFFSNILHIQQHRRLRALRRLAIEAKERHLRSANIAHYLLPLLEHFVFDRADDDGAGNLAAETISAIGSLAEGLEWPQIRAVFRRYTGYISSKPELEKSITKLQGTLIDAIGHAASVKQQILESTLSSQECDSAMDTDANATTHEQHSSALSLTMPRQEKLADDLTRNLLPALMSYLHDKDESTVSLRVPVAVSTVKLLKLLPDAQLADRLPPLLTDVCHILRSRAQEARDMTRKTLVAISTLIGPNYFGFILKELRASLARGYQLHVLSFTVHSILVDTASVFQPGDLDYCLPQFVAIIMDDIFGTTGQEKDAEEYISKMREVKARRSYDSMELIAKMASISHIAHLTRPLQSLLEERLDLRTVKKADELLRRVGAGLLRNAAIESQDTLVFCYEVIQHVYASAKPSASVDSRTKRFLVNTKAAKTGRTRQNTSLFKFKLTKFAFDLLRMVLHKFESLKTQASLSGFMPAIGDALFQTQEEVQVSALRLISEILNVQMTALDESVPTYVSEAVKIIKNALSTNTEISQAALKLVSSVLRERHSVTVKDIDIAYLLKRLGPDLEEPDRQGVTFNFLKAVMSRKIIITEVYETMDTVAAMMVTSQSKGTRDMARGVYFQFLLNYPQGKSRLSKQLTFLTKNLDYKYVEGRQSILESIHNLLSKAPNDLLQEISGMFFVPLVLVSINDDSFDCRKMAGVLLKTLLERAEEDQTKNMLALMKTWLGQTEQSLLIRASLQLYSILLEVDSVRGEKEVPTLQTRTLKLIKEGLANKPGAEWEITYYALQLISKMTQSYPKMLLAANTATTWLTIRECASFPHAWVKLAAARLLGVYFADFARSNAGVEAISRPLKGSNGLFLGDEEMLQIMKASLGALRVLNISDELATQVARNLIFLGRFAPPSASRDGEGDLVSSDDCSSDDEGGDGEKPAKSPLQYMFERLSAILRREPVTTRALSLVPKTAALQICAALCHNTNLPTLEPCVSTLMLPLHHLTDPSIPAPFSTDEDFKTTHQSLLSTSHEIMALLQKKMGTPAYVIVLNGVRAGVKERREGRRVKRRLEAVTAPEKAGRDKIRKGERKRERRKEKSGEHRGNRRGY